VTVLVAGLLNLETSAPVAGFPLDYAPARYPDGIAAVVSGVGWNLALALHTLGTPVRLLGFAGDDPAGRVVRAIVDASGIDATLLPCPRTPQSVILHDETGRRAILTDTAGTPDLGVPVAAFDAAVAGCDTVILSNIDWTRPLLTRARHAGVPVVTDLHAVAGLDNPYDADYLDHADVLFLSGEHLPEPPERFAARVLERSGAQIVVIGLGAGGALLARRGLEPLRVRAPRLRPVVSTTGAGDALLAGFVHFHRRLGDPAEALERAVVFASWKVGARSGAEGFIDGAAVERLAAGPPA